MALNIFSDRSNRYEASSYKWAVDASNDLRKDTQYNYANDEGKSTK